MSSSRNRTLNLSRLQSHVYALAPRLASITYMVLNIKFISFLYFFVGILYLFVLSNYIWTKDKDEYYNDRIVFYINEYFWKRNSFTNILNFPSGSKSSKFFIHFLHIFSEDSLSHLSFEIQTLVPYIFKIKYRYKKNDFITTLQAKTTKDVLYIETQSKNEQPKVIRSVL